MVTVGLALSQLVGDSEEQWSEVQHEVLEAQHEVSEAQHEVSEALEELLVCVVPDLFELR